MMDKSTMLNSQFMITAAILFFAILIMFVFYKGLATALLSLKQKRHLSERIQHFSGRQRPPFSWKKYLHLLPVTETDKAKLGLMLSRAGFKHPDAIFYLVGAKLFGLIVLPLTYIITSDQALNMTLLFKATLVAFVGSMAAEWWLKYQVSKAQERIHATTPDAVDLMVLCAQSGLHMDAIIQRVGKEVAGWSPQLSEELLYTHAQIQLGVGRQDALTDLANRIDSESFHQIVNTLIQSDKYGTPLVQTLKELALDVRRHRALSLEEKMGKIPALMTLPLMIFILLPLVVLLAGPSLISLLRSLQGT